MLESDLYTVKARSKTVITFSCNVMCEADGLGCCFSHVSLEIDVLDLRQGLSINKTLYIGVTGDARGLDRCPDFQLAAGPDQLA